VTPPGRPNVVFILSDEQRWDTLHCCGQPLEISPSLDRMAAEGVRFDKAFTTQPVCGPARACIQTGMYPAELGCYRNNISLPRSVKTLAHYLGDVGYETAYVGKWHLASDGDAEHDFRGRPVPPDRRGGYRDLWIAADVPCQQSNAYEGWLFDGQGRRVPFEGYRTDCFADIAIEYLRGRRPDRPLFLFLSFVEPHPQPYHELYFGPPSKRERFLYRQITYEGPDGSRERFAEAPIPGDLREGEGYWRQYYADYLGACERVDYNVGRVLQTLEELSLLDETVVLFTSDHGEHFYTRHPTVQKCTCHEASIRIPLLIRGPGFLGGRVLPHLVSLADVAPTVLAAAGLEPPPQMRGRPLQQLLAGGADDWPADVLVQIGSTQIARALRTERWKYAVAAPADAPRRVPSRCTSGRRRDHASAREADMAKPKTAWPWHPVPADVPRDRPAGEIYVEDALYDLHADPHEHDNLVREPSLVDIRAELAQRLKIRMAAAGEGPCDILPKSKEAK